MPALCSPAPEALPTLLTSRPQVLSASGGLAKGRRAKPAPLKLPEDYSMPICVRNTFIDTAAELSPSMECFYKKRQVSTCPSAQVGRLASVFQETQLPSEIVEVQSGSEASPSNEAAVVPPVLVVPFAAAPPVPLVQPPAVPAWSGTGLRHVPPPPACPAPGSAEMPSLGSAGHPEGSCKPCAFFHTVGCTKDLACEFCHLCDPEERRRRRRAKCEARRADRARRAFSAANEH